MENALDEIMKTKDVSGIFEVYHTMTFLCYRTPKPGAAAQEVIVEIHDAGPAAGDHRYSVHAKADDDKLAAGNSAASVEEALSIVHWDELDR